MIRDVNGRRERFGGSIPPLATIIDSEGLTQQAKRKTTQIRQSSGLSLVQGCRASPSSIVSTGRLSA